MFRLVVSILTAVARAIWQRLRHGPSAPGWSWRLELAVASQRAAVHEMQDWEPSRMRAAASGVPSRLARQLDREETQLGGVPALRLELPRSEPERFLLYFHGGGYVAGSPRTHLDLVAAMTLAARSRTWSVDYRLAPEHRFPAAVDDVVTAYRAVLVGGVDPARLVIAGDSAGACLCLALLQRLRDEAIPLPTGAALICPAPDMTFPGKSWETLVRTDYLTRPLVRVWVDHYLGDTDPKHPLVSAIHADLSGLPPLLLQVGGGECLYDDITPLIEKLERSGADLRTHVYEHMPHVWHLFRSFLPEGRAACEEVGRFVVERTSQV